MAANGLGMAGGTAVVGAVTGALGTGATACLSQHVVSGGASSREVARRAAQQQVDPGGIVFEDD
jgi:hypothetical protein